jgi:hypothetical protein
VFDLPTEALAMREPREIQQIRYRLLALNDADRAYVRRWLIRWVDESGRVLGKHVA